MRNKKRVAEGEEREAECERIDAEARHRLMLSDEPADEQERQLFPQSASGLLDSERHLEMGRTSHSRVECLADHRLRHRRPRDSVQSFSVLGRRRLGLSREFSTPAINRAADSLECSISRSDAYWAHVDAQLEAYSNLSRAQYELHLQGTIERQLVAREDEVYALYKEAEEQKQRQRRESEEKRAAERREQERERNRRAVEKERQAELQLTQSEDAQMQSRAHAAPGTVFVGTALRLQPDYNCESAKYREVQQKDADLSRGCMESYASDYTSSARVFRANQCWMYEHRVMLRLRVSGMPPP